MREITDEDLHDIALYGDIDLGDGTSLRPNKPLLIKARKDTNGIHFSAPSINFEDLVANYDEIISTTKAMCVLLWTDYAQEDDENLTADAQELKRRMQRDFKVVKSPELTLCDVLTEIRAVGANLKTLTRAVDDLQGVVAGILRLVVTK